MMVRVVCLLSLVIGTTTGLRAGPLRCPVDPDRPAVSTKPPIDPQAAVAELGKLTGQIQVLWTEGKTWGPEQRATKRSEIVESYVRVFAPALAFSGAQLAISGAVLVAVLLALGVSGRGYADIASLGAGVPLLGDALAQVGPGWGNFAIALLFVELAAPATIPLALLITPAWTESLSGWLTEKGFDADGLNAKIAKALGESPRPPSVPEE